MVVSMPQFDSLPSMFKQPTSLSQIVLSSSQTPSIPLSHPHHPLILGSAPLQLSYVLAFDGFPRFLDTGVVQSDRSLIAAFCGQRRDRPLTVQALSGMGTREGVPLSWAVYPLLPCILLTKVDLRPSPTLPLTCWMRQPLATCGSPCLQLRGKWSIAGLPLERGPSGCVFGHTEGRCEGPEHLLSLDSLPGLTMSSGHMAGGHV